MDFVTQKDFFGRLNDHVFEPNFGRRLSLQQMRDVVNGVADVICTVALENAAVRFGKLGTFKLHIKPAGRGWNPRRKKHFKCPKKRKIVFRPSKGTARLFQIQ